MSSRTVTAAVMVVGGVVVSRRRSSSTSDNTSLHGAIRDGSGNHAGAAAPKSSTRRASLGHQSSWNLLV